jgi:ATP:ADP antiporter, AAA family
VVANLGRPASRHAAVRALVAAGDQAVPDIERAFDEERQDRGTRMRMARMAGQIHGPRSTAFLERHMAYPDSEVRALVLEALAGRHYQAAAERRAEAFHLLEAEASFEAWLIASHLDILAVEGPEKELLAELDLALLHERQRCRDMVFYLLSFLHPANPILGAKASLASADAERQAYAIEVLDNVLAADAKALVLPLMEELPAEERLRRLGPRFPQDRWPLHERLAALAERPLAELSSWCKACAIDAIARVDAAELRPAVVAGLESTDPLVRETAVWTLGWIGGDDTPDLVRPLLDDDVKQVVDMAEHVAGQFDNQALIEQLLAAQAS